LSHSLCLRLFIQRKEQVLMCLDEPWRIIQNVRHKCNQHEN
jgi:hypothetical protein